MLSGENWPNFYFLKWQFYWCGVFFNPHFIPNAYYCAWNRVGALKNFIYLMKNNTGKVGKIWPRTFREKAINTVYSKNFKARKKWYLIDIQVRKIIFQPELLLPWPNPYCIFTLSANTGWTYSVYESLWGILWVQGKKIWFTGVKFSVGNNEKSTTCSPLQPQHPK